MTGDADQTGSARKRVAHHLRTARQALGLSQEELAHRAQLHRTYVGSVERAERNISIDSVERLAAALGVDVGRLVAPLNASGDASQADVESRSL